MKSELGDEKRNKSWSIWFTCNFKGKLFLIFIVETQNNEKTNDNVPHRIKEGWMKWKNVLGVFYDTKVPFQFKGKVYKVVNRPIGQLSIYIWILAD